jgi:hypothetical protein
LNDHRPVITSGDPATAPGTNTKEPDMNDTTRRTLESLAELRLLELQARFAEIVGEPTRSPNKKFLCAGSAKLSRHTSKSPSRSRRCRAPRRSRSPPRRSG